jgi:hypothetical protein
MLCWSFFDGEWGVLLGESFYWIVLIAKGQAKMNYNKVLLYGSIKSES